MTLNVSKTKYTVFRKKICTLTPTVLILIGNEILEKIGNAYVNNYFKFVGLKLDEFINWDFQI